MILMACVDGRNGMAFNCRRQSRDRAVRADLLAEAGEEQAQGQQRRRQGNAGSIHGI